jgi:hypothetical protein
MMPGHPHHVIVPGEDPQGILLVPVDGVFFSEAAIIGIGVSDNVLLNIFVDAGNSHNPSSSSTMCPCSASPDQILAFDGGSIA